MAKANLKKVAAGFAALAMMGTAIPMNVFSTDYLVSVSAAAVNSGSGLKSTDYEAVKSDPHEVSNVTMSDRNKAYNQEYVASVYDTDGLKYVNVYVNEVVNPVTGEVTSYTTSGHSYGANAKAAMVDGSVVVTASTVNKNATLGTLDNKPTDYRVRFDNVVTISGTDYYFGGRMYDHDNNSATANVKYMDATEPADGHYDPDCAIKDDCLYDKEGNEISKVAAGVKGNIPYKKGYSNLQCNYSIVDGKVLLTYPIITAYDAKLVTESVFLDDDLKTSNVYMTDEFTLGSSKFVGVHEGTGSGHSTVLDWYEVQSVSKHYGKVTDPDALAEIEAGLGIWKTGKDLTDGSDKKYAATLAKDATDIDPIDSTHNTHINYPYTKVNEVTLFDNIVGNGVKVLEAGTKASVYATTTDGTGTDDIVRYFVDEECTSRNNKSVGDEVEITRVTIYDNDKKPVGERIYSVKIGDTDNTTPASRDSDTIVYKDVYTGNAKSLEDSETCYQYKIVFTALSEKHTCYLADSLCAADDPVEISSIGSSRKFKNYTLYNDEKCTEQAGYTLYWECERSNPSDPYEHITASHTTCMVGSELEVQLRKLVAAKENIRLDDDVKISEDLVIDYDAVIDLKGKSLSVVSGKDAKIKVADGVSLTVINTDSVAKSIEAIELEGAGSSLTLWDASSVQNLTIKAVDGVLAGAITNKGTGSVAKTVVNAETSDWKADKALISKALSGKVVGNGVKYNFTTTETVKHSVVWKMATDPNTLDTGFESTKGSVAVGTYGSNDAAVTTYTFTDPLTLNPLIVSTVKYASIDHGDDYGYIATSKGHKLDCICGIDTKSTSVEKHDFEVLGTVGDNVIVRCKVCGYVTTLSQASAEMTASSLAKVEGELPFVQKYTFAITGGGANIQSYGVFYNKEGKDITKSLDASKLEVKDGKVVSDVAHTTKSVIKTSGTYSVSVGTSTETAGVTVVPYVVVDGKVTLGSAVGDTFKAMAKAEAEENCAITLASAVKDSATAGRAVFTFDVAAENGYQIVEYGLEATKLSDKSPAKATSTKIKTFGTYVQGAKDTVGVEGTGYLTVTDKYGLTHTVNSDTKTVSTK